MGDDSEVVEGASGAPPRVRFDYIKSNYFRVIHADGIWGGVTPTLHIQMAVWSQRSPIPQRVVHAVRPDGGIGEELTEERVVRDAIVREVEADIIMNVDVAEALVAWLQDRIRHAKTLMPGSHGEEAHGEDHTG